MLGNSFIDVVSSLIAGDLSIDQTQALAEEQNQQAEFAIGFMLQQLSRKSLGPGELERLLELAWRFCGAEACLRYKFIPVKNLRIAQSFVRLKMHNEPEKFTDEILEIIPYQWPSNTLEANELRTSRMALRANHLLQQPQQLEQDVAKVREYVSQYNFNSDLSELLAKVEEEIVAGGDAFDQSAILKHIRTFFEKIHQECGERLRREKPETVDGTNLGSCGQAIDYLMRKGVLTEKMKDLAKGLYGILSNEGVHAIKSGREYVRLCRNLVAEYALVLFFELDRRLAE